MDLKAIEKEARRLHTHTIVFTEPNDVLAAVRAMQGRSTKSIAKELGLSEGQVQYRISKAQNSIQHKFRGDYRNGQGSVAQAMLRATERIGWAIVKKEIAPKFIPLSRSRANHK